MPVKQILRGMYWKDEPGRVEAFEKKLGLSKPLDLVRLSNGGRDWSDVKTSASWLAGVASPLKPRMVQPCLQLWPSSMSAAEGLRRLADTAEFDDEVKAIYQGIHDKVGGTYEILHSPLYEGNGDWMPWSITKAMASNAKKVFAKVNKIAKSVSPRFRLCINFAEWNNGNGVTFKDVFPGREHCDDFGMNLYAKFENGNQGGTAAGSLKGQLESKAGLNSMIREAKELGVRGIWIPEWGIRPHAKGAAQTEAVDLSPVVRGVGDVLLREAPNFDRMGYLFWSGRTAVEAYVDPTGTGKFPKLDKAIKELDDRVLAYNAGKGDTGDQPQPEPEKPDTGTPEPSQPPTQDWQPLPGTTPAEIAAAGNKLTFGLRGKPADAATVRAVEDAFWRIAQYQAPKPAPEPPQPVDEPPEPANDVAALQAENASLRAKQEKTNAELEKLRAAVKTASGALAAV